MNEIDATSIVNYTVVISLVVGSIWILVPIPTIIRKIIVTVFWIGLTSYGGYAIIQIYATGESFWGMFPTTFAKAYAFGGFISYMIITLFCLVYVISPENKSKNIIQYQDKNKEINL